MNSGSQDQPPAPSEQMVRAGQIELHVVEHGSGMPIVLVHGFPLDHSMWDAQIDVLGRQWRIIAPDLRGFGRSQVTPGTASMEQMADDVAAMLDALVIDQPVVFVGLSMGGYVAFQFQRKYRDRLRALVLCDTRSAADTPEAVKARHATVEQLQSGGISAVIEAMMPKLFGPAALDGPSEDVVSMREVMLSCAPEGMAAALRGMAARDDATAALGEIGVPTLVLVGEHDAISPVDEMRAIAQAVPNAEFVVIPASGHMSPVENPTAFNEAITQFLMRVERGGPLS